MGPAALDESRQIDSGDAATSPRTTQNGVSAPHHISLSPVKAATHHPVPRSNATGPDGPPPLSPVKVPANTNGKPAPLNAQVATPDPLTLTVATFTGERLCDQPAERKSLPTNTHANWHAFPRRRALPPRSAATGPDAPPPLSPVKGAAAAQMRIEFRHESLNRATTSIRIDTLSMRVSLISTFMQ